MQLNWDYRITEFLELAKRFNEETGYPVTYSYDNAKNYVWRLVNDKCTAIFVHYEEGKLAGSIIVHYDNEFSNEFFGYVGKMYVLPEYRGTWTGRALLQEACDWFDDNKCILSFATATAGIGQDKLFTNLLGKFGFAPQGGILIRKGKQHE